MLKRLAILAVLLTVAQTSVPVPGQASNSPAHRSAQANQSTRRTQQPAASPSTAQNATEPNPPKDPASSVHDKDAERTVAITKSVTVSVSRDWLDYATWGGGLALLVVGVLGILLANRTLKAVEKQAALMKDQLNTARQKERPKLRIQFENVDLQFTESPDVVRIGCTIQNHGGSVAFIIGSVCGCWIDESTVSEERRHTAFAMNTPTVLGPGEKATELAVVLADDDRVVDLSMWNSDDSRIKDVRNGSKSIYASGFVMYTNIFDETWMLSFKQKFTAQNLGHGVWSGEWYRDGDEENYERQEITKAN